MIQNTGIKLNFVDRMNEAEATLNELVSFAEHLSNRLAGYSDMPESGWVEDAIPSGIFPEMADRADRMAARARNIRSSLQRIYDALPAETAAKSLVGSQYNPTKEGPYDKINPRYL